MSHHCHHHGDRHNSCNRQESSDTLSLEEKLSKLLDHWVHHNDDHALNYRDWGSKAKVKGLDEVARLLEEAAQMTEKVSEVFNTAAATLKSKP
jgi:hypothetical protein